MSGKRLFTISLAAVSLMACARPKYASEAPLSNETLNHENKASCSYTFQASSFCLSWNWEQKPTASQAGSLVFKVFRLNLYDQSQVVIDTAAVPEVILWMPSMGHGSSPTQTQRLDVGTYRASNVFFIMPGEWEIKFQVKAGNSIQDEAVVAITF